MLQAGDASTTLSDGTIVKEDAQGVIHQTSPDGTTLELFKDGVQIQRNVDGTTITTDPSGTRLQVNPDGTRIATMKDGTQLVTHVDGTKVQTDPDGTQIVLRLDGTKKQVRPDGSSLLFQLDGLIIETGADGKQHTLQQASKSADQTTHAASKMAVKVTIMEGSKMSTELLRQTTVTMGEEKKDLHVLTAAEVDAGWKIESADLWGQPGQVDVTGNAITYTAEQGYTGPAVIWYVLKDASGQTQERQIEVHVCAAPGSESHKDYQVAFELQRSSSDAREAVRLA